MIRTNETHRAIGFRALCCRPLCVLSRECGTMAEMDASPQSPSHSVVINVAKSRKGALPERVSFGEGKPECVTEDAWNNVTPALQARGTPASWHACDHGTSVRRC